LLALVFVLAVPVLLGTLWLRWELVTPYYGAAEAETFVDIPRGSTTGVIAGLLSDAGVLHARLPFQLYSRWSGTGRRFQAGEYRFTAPATPIQVAQRMIQGDVFFRSVTIPEGLTAQETIEQLSRSGLGNQEEMERALHRTEWIRDLAPEAGTLEGYLFPDTYRFSRKTTSEQIIHTMVDQFRVKIAKLSAERPLPPGWQIGRLVTLASLIEKEVGTQAERLKVASVFYNRIEKGMPLACDPTVIYALKLAGKYDGDIRKTDLQINSPYNTYIHPGLPPGPIANPGLDSLRAALNPPKTDFLYFVSRNDGTHEFSKTYESHQIAVSRFQKHMRH
jgi:UPF0755 protein